MAVIGHILNIKIENVTNIVTRLYNHSDIYNKVLEIKKNILTRMSSADTFISKRDNKIQLQYRKNIFKRRGENRKALE